MGHYLSYIYVIDVIGITEGEEKSKILREHQAA